MDYSIYEDAIYTLFFRGPSFPRRLTHRISVITFIYISVCYTPPLNSINYVTCSLIGIDAMHYVRGPRARTLALRSEYFVLLVPIGQIVTHTHLILRGRQAH